MPEDTAHAATVYFDGACPVCRREVAMYRRQPGADALRWVDAAHCAPEALGPDLGRADALARLHLRHPDGRLVQGAAAFTGLWRLLPRWHWLGRALDNRVAVALLDPAYRLFLRVRPLWRARAPAGRPGETA